MNQDKVRLQQAPAGSPQRFSKTFGKEKTLDKILQTADDDELLASLGKSAAPSEEVKSPAATTDFTKQL